MGKNLVSVYVMSQSCNKTHFCMIYTVWQVFPGFLITFVKKKKKTLLYAEFRVFWKEKGSRRCRGPRWATAHFWVSVATGVGLRQEIPVATRHCTLRAVRAITDDPGCADDRVLSRQRNSLSRQSSPR